MRRPRWRRCGGVGRRLRPALQRMRYRGSRSWGPPAVFPVSIKLPQAVWFRHAPAAVLTDHPAVTYAFVPPRPELPTRALGLLEVLTALRTNALRLWGQEA